MVREEQKRKEKFAMTRREGMEEMMREMKGKEKKVMRGCGENKKGQRKEVGSR